MHTRQKYQRPQVKSVGKHWKARYREYFLGPDGQETAIAKAASWLKASHTKGQAQLKCDQLIQNLGPAKPDGSLTLGEFYETIYLPIRSRRWTGNTSYVVESLWRNHLQPKLGHLQLKDISKATIQLHLIQMADAGYGHSSVEAARVRLLSILEEASDNDYILKNPAKKVELPLGLHKSETRSLTLEEIQLLWDGTDGMDYLLWRVMILTGARPGEVIALTRSDITPDGLVIDETILNGQTKLPKRNKIRLAILPESLRDELNAWLETHQNPYIFPSSDGRPQCSTASGDMHSIQARGRSVGIPDLTFRMCRTTFATHFDGDEADRSSIMGHTSTAFTLAKYRKPLQERRLAAVEALDKRLRTKVIPIRKVAS